jgi:hypothetical protein
MDCKKMSRTVGLLLLSCSLVGAQTVTSFDAQGAGTGPRQGTFSLAIHSAGMTTGYFLDVNFASHGFVRATDGTLAEFDIPMPTAPSRSVSIRRA